MAGATALLLAAAAVPAAQAPVVRSLHVQGNVWMLHSDTVNAAAQIGDDGVLIVDTMTDDLAEPLLAEVRRIAPGKPIRIIVNTHVHSDHTGGNARISAAGSTVIGGNAVAQLGQAAAERAQIYAHENVQVRMAQPARGEPPVATANWPSDTFIEPQHDLYFNGEGIELLHQPAAHTDGDTIVYFRKSDVVVTGDIYVNELFPMVDAQSGGDFGGLLQALNTILRLTIPKARQEGGTYVIPGHGRLADEADVVEYRDMATVLRDRIADAVKRGQTLAQVKSARLTRDYEGRYGTTQSFWSTDHFVDTVYQSLAAAKPAGRSGR
jgi:glyoxylase-like metal-dependent hydrolase (beta-lactamase superfamily II)